MFDQLEIPAFLRRDTTAPEAGRTERRAVQRARRARPKDDLITVHLHDEIPRIGCGIRRIAVARLGRKWVSLRVPGKARAVRVSRRVWDKIKVLP